MSNKKSEKIRLALVDKARNSHLADIDPESIKVKILYKIEDYDYDYISVLKPVIALNIKRMLVNIVRSLNIFEFKINIYFSNETIVNKSKPLLFEVLSYDNLLTSLGFLSMESPDNRKQKFHSLFDINKIDEFSKNLHTIPSENFYLYSYHYESSSGQPISYDKKQISLPLTKLRKFCYEFLDKLEKECDFYCEEEISYIEYVCLVGKDTDFYVRFSKKSMNIPKEYIKIRKLNSICDANIIQSLAESGIIPYDISTNQELLNSDLKQLFEMIKLLDY